MTAHRTHLIVSALVVLAMALGAVAAPTASAAGAPNSCIAGPNAAAARAAARAGITAASTTSTRPTLITITAARNMWGWQENGRLVPGVDTLQQEMDALAAIPLPGTSGSQSVPVDFATVPGFTPNTGSYPASSSMGIIYPSFSLLSCFKSAYGSEVGMDYGAIYPKDLNGLSSSQVRSDSCATQQTFVNHGFTRSWGAFAWAGGAPVSGAASIVDSCFAFGRTYGIGANAIRSLLSPPYSVATLSLNGGSCAATGAACASIFHRTYVQPSAITQALLAGPGNWTSVQFYHLLRGSRSSGKLRFDCTSSNPAYHWTNMGEDYCESDLVSAVQRALAKLTPGSYQFVDPASAALIIGRGKPLGAL